MPLSAHEAKLVRDSFDKLEAELETHSTYFYETFFGLAPDLRSMFRDDLSGQGMKFMTTLRNIIRHIDANDAYFETLTDLGQGHAKLGVSIKSFQHVEDAMIATLANALGDGFSKELEEAWRQAFADISSTMIRKGGIT